METEFEKELEHLINRHCKENDSNTPDFILAKYLQGCLNNFNDTVNQRERWYGREPEVVDIPVSDGERTGDVPENLKINQTTGTPPIIYPTTTSQ